MIDRTRCMRSNASLATVFGAEELKFCQEPATHESKLTGRLCAHHAEEQREAQRQRHEQKMIHRRQAELQT